MICLEYEREDDLENREIRTQGHELMDVVFRDPRSLARDLARSCLQAIQSCLSVIELKRLSYLIHRLIPFSHFNHAMKRKRVYLLVR